LGAVALELDGVLGETRRLWRDWVADAARRARVELRLPDDLAPAAEMLDGRLGNWCASAFSPTPPGPRARVVRRILGVPERKHLDDRQLDALLERLDKLVDEIHALNRRLDHSEGFARLAHEVRNLNESLQALAYAALGQQGPQVRRRRAG
jgi:hypothetical protein